MKSLILLCMLLSSTAYSQVGMVGGKTLTNGALVTGDGRSVRSDALQQLHSERIRRYDHSRGILKRRQ